MNVPDCVGVPLIVIVFDAHAAVTPVGNPVGVPIPVAFIVVWVILGIKVLIHTVGVDEATLATLPTVSVNVLPALIHPPLVLTVSVPVKVPAGVLAGTFNTIGLEIALSTISKR